MIPWELKITKGSNGYKLTWREQLDDESIVTREAYVQEDEDAAEDEAESLAGAELLYKVIEHFSLYGSKHNKYRLLVGVEHGDNYQCQGCDLCSGTLSTGN